MSAGVVVHYDAEGAAAAIEVDQASARTDLKALHALGIDKVQVEAAWAKGAALQTGLPYRYGASSSRLRAISRSQRSPFASRRSLS
ncbi:hypothetical protein [Amphiplicatus metriothermophilus]|uniref:hypothetical protein n=1 Tax=Amphiplicatus metriothermophilus TaxID=1519374 RepID=UPI0035D4D149